MLIPAIAVFLLLVCVVLFGSSKRVQPMLEGKPLSFWQAEIQARTTDELLAEFSAFGPEALPVLLKALETHPGVMQNVYEAAYTKLPAAITVRFPVPENCTDLRFQAANILGAMGSNAAPAIPALSRALNDKEPSVRRCASSALIFVRMRLGRNHPTDAESVVQLSRAMKDPDPDVRYNAVHGAYWFGDAATNALPIIQQATQDVDPRVRATAARALRDVERAKSRKP